MNSLIPYIQIIVAVGLMSLILLQQGGSGLGSAFGGDGGGGGDYSTRRGVQKHLFTGTVILGAIFIALAVINLL